MGKTKYNMFEVNGQDKDDRWLVKHPCTGDNCSGTWASKEDAQKDCDRWNERRRKALEN